MNNLYHKVAVACVCTILGFALGANKEAKAAKFYLDSTTNFMVEDIYTSNGYGIDGLGDRLLTSVVDYAFDYFGEPKFPNVAHARDRERRDFYEFNIGNLPLAPNTVITEASLVFKPTQIQSTRYNYLDILGYVGNGKPDVSDFQAGVVLATEYASNYFPYGLPDSISFDVTNFVNQRVSNRDAFVGFGIRISNFPFSTPLGVVDYYPTSLQIETVPEPTTIFGSALALSLGGWLKRKKSSQQNKTTSQH